MKVVILLNHTITQPQKDELKNRFSVSEIVDIPQNIKKIWEQVPPEGEFPPNEFEKITEFLKINLSVGDYIWVQGEFGATVYLVDFAFKEGFIPIYATTKRYYEEDIQPDGSISMKHVFKHVQFRKYTSFKSIWL